MISTEVKEQLEEDVNGLSELNELQKGYAIKKAYLEQLQEECKKEQEELGLLEKLDKAEGEELQNTVDRLVEIEDKYDIRKASKAESKAEKELMDWFLNVMEKIQEREIEIDNVTVDENIDIDEIRDNLFMPSVKSNIIDLAMKLDHREVEQVI